MSNFFNNVKIGATTAVGTISTGVATVLSLIPDDIGKLATLIGIILSVVLIYNHWRKGRNEEQKNMLEIQMLELQLERERRKGVPQDG